MINSIVFFAEALSSKDQSNVEFWLMVTGLGVLSILLLLIGFVGSLRLIALKTTRPCRSCMEFIPKSATVCPRCGKE